MTATCPPVETGNRLDQRIEEAARAVHAQYFGDGNEIESWADAPQEFYRRLARTVLTAAPPGPLEIAAEDLRCDRSARWRGNPIRCRLSRGHNGEHESPWREDEPIDSRGSDLQGRVEVTIRVSARFAPRDGNTSGTIRQIDDIGLLCELRNAVAHAFASLEGRQ